MIDFHCHLDLYPDGLEVARHTNQRNDFTLVVTTSPRAYHATSRVFGRLPRLHVALGLHPEVAQAKASELDALVAGISGARFIGKSGSTARCRIGIRCRFRSASSRLLSVNARDKVVV